jgi:hypothetical protein
MRANQWIASASFIVIGVLGSAPALAQQTTGAPGSPDVTTTIDGRYLPPPDQPFQGEIDLNATQSCLSRRARCKLVRRQKGATLARAGFLKTPRPVFMRATIPCGR